MGTRRLVWGTGALLGAVLVVAAMLPARGAPEPDRVAAAQLLVLINADRSEAGLAPLVPSTAAADVAEAWSQFMSDIDDLAHNDGWFTTETRRRLGAGALGENVATNVDLDDAHHRLMNSPGHRANILDPRFTHVGIGAVNGPTGAWWITQDFFQMKEAPAVAPPPPPPASEPPPPAPAAPAVPAAPVDARPAPEPPPSEPSAAATSTVPPPALPAAPAAIASTADGDAPPVSIEPRELPASDPDPVPFAAAPVERPVSRPVVPVAVALLLIAANVQRLRRARTP